MTDERLLLLSTLLSLPDGDRAPAERGLVALARSAALGDLAADVAHDVANPLFGVLGLVDLLLEDMTPGSEDEERLRLLREAALEMKRAMRTLLDFARPTGGERPPADLAAAVRSALALVRHGIGRTLEVEERYPAEPELVACPEPLLVQAVLHLLLAARRAGGPVTAVVADGGLRLSPAGPESLDELVAARIAADHGGTLDRHDGALTLSLPRA